MTSLRSEGESPGIVDRELPLFESQVFTDTAQKGIDTAPNREDSNTADAPHTPSGSTNSPWWGTLRGRLSIGPTAGNGVGLTLGPD